jgi:hypothetical protein
MNPGDNINIYAQPIARETEMSSETPITPPVTSPVTPPKVSPKPVHDPCDDISLVTLALSGLITLVYIAWIGILTTQGVQNSRGSGLITSFHSYHPNGTFIALGNYDGKTKFQADLTATISLPYGYYPPRSHIVEMRACVVEPMDLNCTRQIAVNGKNSLRLNGKWFFPMHDEAIYVKISIYPEIAEWVTLTGSLEVMQGDGDPSYARMNSMHTVAMWFFGLIPIIFVAIKLLEYWIDPPYPTPTPTPITTEPKVKTQ